MRHENWARNDQAGGDIDIAAWIEFILAIIHKNSLWQQAGWMADSGRLEGLGSEVNYRVSRRVIFQEHLPEYLIEYLFFNQYV